MPNTYLALDFGLKRIGVAVGNDLTQTTQGITSLAANNGEPNWDDIWQLQAEWKPQAWILGEPLSVDGEETDFSQRIKTFGKTLGEKTARSVHYADERYSSNEAEHLLREGVAQGKRFNKKKVAAKDQLAAELILQAWFRQGGG